LNAESIDLKKLSTACFCWFVNSLMVMVISLLFCVFVSTSIKISANIVIAVISNAIIENFLRFMPWVINSFLQ